MACSISETNCFLSKRTEILHNWQDFLVKYFTLCNSDPYDSKSNPNGFINFGTAVNNLSNDLIYPKITSDNVWSCDQSLLGYGDSHGSLRLRRAIAILMTELLNTYEPVDPDNLVCTVGVTSSLDLLAHCLADPGDVILAPTPIYARIYTDFLQRSLVEMWPIPIISKDNAEANPELTLEKVEASYNRAKQKGKCIKAVLLINPSNPLGDVYSPELIMKILEFCSRKKIHAIIDEVYALSVHDSNCNFKSTLAFPSLPDVKRTHILYGMSKDFALAGLRIGVIHSKCPFLLKCLIELSQFHQIPFPVMNIAARFWEDLEWCKIIVNVNKQRLQLQFEFFKNFLEKIGLSVRKSKSAFFLWVDFREKCQIKTFDDEIKFFNFLVEEFHVYIVPGKEMFCEQPGWFRITFTNDPEHAKTGLKRLSEAVQKFILHSQLINISDSSENKERNEESFKNLKMQVQIEKGDCIDEGLENLVQCLKSQIKESDWLTVNTSEKWINDNPELSELFVKKTMD